MAMPKIVTHLLNSKACRGENKKIFFKKKILI